MCIIIVNIFLFFVLFPQILNMKNPAESLLMMILQDFFQLIGHSNHGIV